jgi:hypothetical protein
MHHRASTQVEQVLALPNVAPASSLPLPYVPQRVLHLYPLPELRPALRRALALPELLKQSRSSGWMLTLLALLFLLLVQRSLRGHSAHLFLGKRTTPPTSKGISTPAGQRNNPPSQSISKALLGKCSPLLRPHALCTTLRALAGDLSPVRSKGTLGLCVTR